MSRRAASENHDAVAMAEAVALRFASRVAGKFSPEEWKQHKREHPGADPRDHTITKAKPDKPPKADKPKRKVDDADQRDKNRRDNAQRDERASNALNRIIDDEIKKSPQFKEYQKMSPLDKAKVRENLKSDGKSKGKNKGKDVSKMDGFDTLKGLDPEAQKRVLERALKL